MTYSIKKRHIEEAVQFAIRYVPHVDPGTLEKFLALVNTKGTHGALTPSQIVTKIQLLTKYVPSVCHNSLLELLEVPLNEVSSAPRWLTADDQFQPMIIPTEPKSRRRRPLVMAT